MMAEEMYHMFWLEPVGQVRRYEATDDLSVVQEMVRKANADERDEYSNVAGLKVIYGRLLEFEPAEIIKSWRVKGIG